MSDTGSEDGACQCNEPACPECYPSTPEQSDDDDVHAENEDHLHHHHYYYGGVHHHYYSARLPAWAPLNRHRPPLVGPPPDFEQHRLTSDSESSHESENEEGETRSADEAPRDDDEKDERLGDLREALFYLSSHYTSDEDGSGESQDEEGENERAPP